MTRGAAGDCVAPAKFPHPMAHAGAATCAQAAGKGARHDP